MFPELNEPKVAHVACCEHVQAEQANINPRAPWDPLTYLEMPILVADVAHPNELLVCHDIGQPPPRLVHAVLHLRNVRTSGSWDLMLKYLCQNPAHRLVQHTICSTGGRKGGFQETFHSPMSVIV